MLLKVFLAIFLTCYLLKEGKAKGVKPTCSKGYRFDEVLKICVDIDECQIDNNRSYSPCPLDTFCVNFKPSYYCAPIACPTGYNRSSENPRICTKLFGFEGFGEIVYDHIVLPEADSDFYNEIYTINRSGKDSFKHRFFTTFSPNPALLNSDYNPLKLSNFFVKTPQTNHTDAVILVSGPLTGFSSCLYTIEKSYIINGHSALITKYILYVFVDDEKGDFVDQSAKPNLDPQFKLIEQKLSTSANKIVRKMETFEQSVLWFLNTYYFHNFNYTFKSNSDKVIKALNITLSDLSLNNTAQFNKLANKTTENADYVLNQTYGYLDRSKLKYSVLINQTANQMEEQLLTGINKILLQFANDGETQFEKINNSSGKNVEYLISYIEHIRNRVLRLLSYEWNEQVQSRIDPSK